MSLKQDISEITESLKHILPIQEWETVASKIPPAKSGKFSVVKRSIGEGKCLPMNDVFGYRDTCFLKDTTITVLYEGETDPKTDPKGVWMSDSPFETYGMAQLAARTKPGKVLVGGLGLGILSNLLANRENIDQVIVVEKSPEIVRLVKDYLHPKVKVIEGDFLEAIWKLEREGKEFSTVIADIYKTCGEEEKELYEATRDTMMDSFPDAEHLSWCFQDEYEEDKIRYYLLEKKLQQQEELK